jgi:hypothetical protein
MAVTIKLGSVRARHLSWCLVRRSAHAGQHERHAYSAGSTGLKCGMRARPMSPDARSAPRRCPCVVDWRPVCVTLDRSKHATPARPTFVAASARWRVPWQGSASGAARFWSSDVKADVITVVPGRSSRAPSRSPARCRDDERRPLPTLTGCPTVWAESQRRAATCGNRSLCRS